jgi:serine/threonine protein phosphatase PrpC
MTLSLRFATTSLTHPGMVRSANEDSFIALEDSGVWMVADGMGGHANGQWASTTVVAAVGAARFTRDFDADVEALTGAIQAANTTIFEASKPQGARMGSTVAALYLNETRFACVWAGDSRIYLLREGVLHRMTRDHTQVEALVERGLLTPEQAVGHPMSHVLSRAVGVEAVLDLDAVSDEAQPRDIFLLCSDGLSGVVSEAEIRERLMGFPRENACNRLLELVLARGAPDNVTLIAVACEEKTALTLSPASAL